MTDRKCVLVVEDNKVNPKIITSFLKQRNLTFLVAENGLDALDLIERESFDLILMDIQMPKMGGIECTKKIRSHKSPKVSRVPIIVVSANVTRKDQQDCLDAGANHFLGKLIKKDILYKTIELYI